MEYLLFFLGSCTAAMVVLTQRRLLAAYLGAVAATAALGLTGYLRDPTTAGVAECARALLAALVGLAAGRRLGSIYADTAHARALFLVGCAASIGWALLYTDMIPHTERWGYRGLIALDLAVAAVMSQIGEVTRDQLDAVTLRSLGLYYAFQAIYCASWEVSGRLAAYAGWMTVFAWCWATFNIAREGHER